MNLEEIRSQIPLLSKRVYLDNAGAGPPPLQVYDTMHRVLDEWRDYGEKWEEWLPEIVNARKKFANLISANGDDVACIPNATSGLAAIATALPQKPGRNVVVSELNFPTNIFIWHSLKRKGWISEVRVLKANEGQISISDFEKAIDDETAAVSIDHVSWINGCREDVENVTRIAHSHGSLMIVDAFHALGVFPVDVRRLGVDVLTCGTYKWLMGPHGTAFLYVNPEILSQLEPSIIGWHGISDSVITRAQSGQEPFQRPFNLNGLEPAKNAAKFEWGTWSIITVAGARAAIEYTLSHPPGERFPRIEKLTERLLDGVRMKLKKVTSPDGKERRSGIVTFEVEGAQTLARKLQQEGVVVAPRVNTLRVSPHFYNTEEEIDKLLEKIP